MHKLTYERPHAELLKLEEPMSIMESFSGAGGVEDWNEGSLLDSELGNLSGGSDWNKGNGLTTD